MTEKQLQDKLVRIIKNNRLVESITNVTSLSESSKIDLDENYIPNFSIDSLLRKKYSESGQRVVDSLYGYEFISGEKIRNISLKKGELLYPDCVLFNYETQQIILIENKVSVQTERQALTELFGYAQEIRNHIPFLSSFEISYIIITSDFSTLLDHSLSGQILGTNFNLLCLKPVINKNKLSFEIHFPKSWTDIGQDNLPQNALVSYTLCLSKKKHLDKDFDHVATIQVASDLISYDGERFNSSGFYLVWENGIKDSGSFDFGISIYILNPFAFLDNALQKGFVLNKESALLKYLIKNKNQLNTPSSLFRVADKAKKFLEEYFDVEWDRSSNWETDVTDYYYCLQRLPVLFNSWGAIGEFLRYYYIHPAVRKHYFQKAELNDFGYLRPFVGLQIINSIAGIELFKNGQFLVTDIFKFGIQLRMYRYACENAIQLPDEETTTAEANLFWNSIFLRKSLKDIVERANDLKRNIKQGSINIYLNKRDVPKGYPEEIDKIASSFKDEFLSMNYTHKFIFSLAYDHSFYFNPTLKEMIDLDSLEKIETIISHQARLILLGSIKTYQEKTGYIQKSTLDIIRKQFSLPKKNFSNASDILDELPDALFASNFNYILQILDETIGEVYHDIKPHTLPKSIDWTWFQERAKERFSEGLKFTVLEISSNGNIGIGQLNPSERTFGELKSSIEVFVKYNTAGIVTIIKSTWSELRNGNIELI